jgi:hypothetical protein
MSIRIQPTRQLFEFSSRKEGCHNESVYANVSSSIM